MRDHRLTLAILLGGAAGALARVELDRTLAYGGERWPWATFAANVAGALVLGFVVVALERRPRAAALLGPGFCSALTTFSTLQVELLRLGRHGHAALAAGYLAASLVCGLAAASAGSALARRPR